MRNFYRKIQLQSRQNLPNDANNLRISRARRKSPTNVKITLAKLPKTALLGRWLVPAVNAANLKPLHLLNAIRRAITRKRHRQVITQRKRLFAELSQLKYELLLLPILT